MKVKFILLTDRERSGGMSLPGLKKQSDISCEEIKTRPVYEAYGEPSCTIDKKRREMELTQCWSRIKFDILTVIQLISHLARIFSYLWKKFHESCTQIQNIINDFITDTKPGSRNIKYSSGNNKKI